MGIKFFGHYLLDEGKLNNEQLVEAISYQSEHNLSLGELAVREGFITAKEADTINDRQRSLDKRFGEVAISLELLDDPQIDELLTIQKREKIFFGEILILKNFMSQDQLDAELAHFESEQKLEVVELDDKIAAIDKDGIIKDSIGILQKLYSRIVHDHIKLVQINSASEINRSGIIALQKMRGDVHLDFSLQPEDAVSLAISTKFLLCIPYSLLPTDGLHTCNAFFKSEPPPLSFFALFLCGLGRGRGNSSVRSRRGLDSLQVRRHRRTFRIRPTLVQR